MVKKLTVPLLLLIILLGCQKTANDHLPADTASMQSTARTGNARLSNEVHTPDPPPTSITNDLVVSNPGGTDFLVITASDYNTLAANERAYYSGLKNSLQYLIADAASGSTSLTFNIDGSYVITVNTNPDTEDGSNARSGGGSCTACGIVSAFSCLGKIDEYLRVHQRTTLTATFTLVTVGGDQCLKIVYRDDWEPTTPLPEGTVVETYTPATTPPDPNPPFTFTFPLAEFSIYVADVQYWALYQREASEEPIPNPEHWSRQELLGFIVEFNGASSHPVHNYQHNVTFQTELTYYVNNIWTASPGEEDTE